MTEYIEDGMPHALDKETGYLLTRTGGECDIREIREKLRDLYKRYAEYLVQSDKARAIEYIMSAFDMHLSVNDFLKSLPDTRVVYRRPEVISPLALYGTVCLTFKRIENDGL